MGYEYSEKEKLLTAFISGFSNFALIPGLFLMKYKRRYFEFYIGFLTFLSSFLYHFTESIAIKIILKPGRWHKLDNIGSISGINSLLINNFNNFSSENKLEANFISLIIIFLFQFDHFWKIENTIFPILICLACMLVNFILKGVPRVNKEMLLRGLFFLIIAIIMFIFGLDDEKDYLRIYHSLWHFFIGIATFYLWQVQESDSYSYIDFCSINFLKSKFFKSI